MFIPVDWSLHSSSFFKMILWNTFLRFYIFHAQKYFPVMFILGRYCDCVWVSFFLEVFVRIPSMFSDAEWHFGRLNFSPLLVIKNFAYMVIFFFSYFFCWTFCVRLFCFRFCFLDGTFNLESHLIPEKSS